MEPVSLMAHDSVRKVSNVKYNCKKFVVNVNTFPKELKIQFVCKRTGLVFETKENLFNHESFYDKYGDYYYIMTFDLERMIEDIATTDNEDSFDIQFMSSSGDNEIHYDEYLSSYLTDNNIVNLLEFDNEKFKSHIVNHAASKHMIMEFKSNYSTVIIDSIIL